MCKENGIRLKISISDVSDKEFPINAYAAYDETDGSFHICLYPDCLDLSYRILTKTERFTEDDLLFFEKVKGLSIFERFPEDTYREELNNLFGSIILLHIFFHECGHILAGHVGSTKLLLNEYDSSRKGSYAMQEHEMVADWLSTKYIFTAMFHAVNKLNTDNEEKLRIMEKITVLYWLSLTLEFQIFDDQNRDRPAAISERTHPLHAVRLYYNTEAAREALSDILLTCGLSPEDADMGSDIIVRSVLTQIESFIVIMDVPIDLKKYDRTTVECYMKLRDVPYEGNKEERLCKHLCRLPENYRESVEDYYRRINSE